MAIGLLNNFPTTCYAVNVCKPWGEKTTCRYLLLCSDGYKCGKYESIRSELKTGGDNCGGLLEIILQNQKELADKAITWKQTFPTFQNCGKVKSIKVEGNKLNITALWEIEGVNSISFNINDLNIKLMPGKIIFSEIGMPSISQAVINL